MIPTVLVTGATGLIGFRVLVEVLNHGYNVRFTARSQEKVRKVLSNPATQKLSPGDRLTSIIVPDVTVDGAFDAALEDVTYVLYVGSPVPVPGYDAFTQVWLPTVKGQASLLASARKFPKLKRIVITSSIVANMTPTPDPSVVATASSRVQLPDQPPSTFATLFEAYILGKITTINDADTFVAENKPHFTIAYVSSGYVFGRNELALDAKDLLTESSSDNFLMTCITGGEVPFPIHGGYIHIDDLAMVHLKALDTSHTPGTVQSLGASTDIDYSVAFDYIQKAFPKAVADGTFARGKLPTLCISFDSSETEKILDMKYRTFENAVVDTAAQYLEKLGKDLA